MDSSTSNTDNKPCSYKFKNGDMCKNECKHDEFNYCQKHSYVKNPRNKQCRICNIQWICENTKTQVCRDCRKLHPYEYIKDLRNASKVITLSKPMEYEYIIRNEEDEPRTMEEELLYHIVGLL